VDAGVHKVPRDPAAAAYDRARGTVYYRLFPRFSAYYR
jgi:hypothetical protein